MQVLAQGNSAISFRAAAVAIVGDNRSPTHNLSARADYAETGMSEITPEKSASVYEGVRSNRYDLLEMSLDENRVLLELSPSMDEKAIFQQLSLATR